MNIPGLSMDPDDQRLPWKETRVPGVHWLPLHLDSGPQAAQPDPGPQRAGATVLIRMAPGASYGAHRHLGSEDVLVLRGGYRDEAGEYRCGEFVHYPPGSQHRPVALGQPDQAEGPQNPACVLFAVAGDGIELLERDES